MFAGTLGMNSILQWTCVCVYIIDILYGIEKKIGGESKRLSKYSFILNGVFVDNFKVGVDDDRLYPFTLFT